MSKRSYKIDICPICKVRDGDSSPKKLYKCEYCGEYFCEKHLKPKHTLTSSQIEKIRDPLLKEKLYEEWRREDAHPCPSYTSKLLDEIEKKKKEEYEAYETIPKYKEVITIPRVVHKIEKNVETEGGLKHKNKSKSIKRTKKEGSIRYRDRFSVVLDELLTQIKKKMYNILKYFIIITVILSIIHFIFYGKIEFWLLITRSALLIILGYFLHFIYSRTKDYIPYKWLIFGSIIILVIFTLSTKNYSYLELVDKFLGLSGFSNKTIEYITRNIYQPILMSMTEDPEITKCKEKTINYIENMKTQVYFDFSYKILEAKVFNNTKDAEEYAKTKVTPPSSYLICDEKIKQQGLIPSKKIISVLYEIRLKNPLQICIGACMTIEKLTDVIYCDNDGNVLKKC